MKIFLDIGSHIGQTLREVTKEKYAFDKIWAYLDITDDGRLSLAEIARFQRRI